jgi:type III pantothenate kinase
MLLVIDVGNTNTVIGMFEGERLLADWRIETRPGRTSDEHGMLLRQLISARNLSPDLVTAGVLACVVPPAQSAVERAMRQTFRVEPLVVGPGVRTGMPILMENPREVGADRIVNALAAWHREHAGCIVVDFGTATTFDVISAAGEYLGGVICPGLVISANALYHAAAKLPRVPLEKPKRVVGKATVESMQAGLVYGYVGLVDGLVERMRAELDFPVRVYATGGQAIIVAEECQHIDVIAPELTLEGLRILYTLNQ